MIVWFIYLWHLICKTYAVKFVNLLYFEHRLIIKLGDIIPAYALFEGNSLKIDQVNIHKRTKLMYSTLGNIP